MENVTTIGIDLAKNVFQVYGTDSRGNKVFDRQLRRSKLSEFMVQQPRCLIGMEACGGAHYWARCFETMGHEVKLMSPQYVKPYVKTNKNDSADAQACSEAVTRPSMRFVSIKTVNQQEIQSVHRVRSHFVGQRTALMNQIRGLLAEYGVVTGQGKAALVKKLREVTHEEGRVLTVTSQRLMGELSRELTHLDEQVAFYTKHLKKLSEEDERCVRLQSIPGVGPLSASAYVAKVNDGSEFKRGRDVSAYLGLVPKQHSSGGKEKLGGISKRGDRYLRCLMIHGARAVAKVVMADKDNKQDAHSVWIRELIGRCGINKAVVAIANKNARMAWALLRNGTTFEPKRAHAEAVD